ncbi:hypothetical protein ACQ4WX_49030 [Streptomyces lasalocidi]
MIAACPRVVQRPRDPSNLAFALAAAFPTRLAGTQQLILQCLCSRHGDGWVRQRHLEQIVASREPWATPFVMQLAA